MSRYAKIESQYTQVTDTQTTFSALASDSSFNDSGDGFIVAGFEVGNLVTVTGFVVEPPSFGQNNVTKAEILSLTASKMVVDAVLVDADAGDSVTISAEPVLVPGSETVVETREMADNFDPDEVKQKGDYRILIKQDDPVFDPDTHILVTPTSELTSWSFVINPADVEATRLVRALTQEELDANAAQEEWTQEQETAKAQYDDLQNGVGTSAERLERTEKVAAHLLKVTYGL